MILVVLGVLLLVFILSRMAGDPIVALLGEGATQEAYNALKSELGLDRPLPVQFVDFISNALKGDLGTDYIMKQSVSRMIAEKLPISLALTAMGLCLALIVGVPLGVAAATHHNGKMDYLLTLMAMLFASIPGFWLAMMGIILFTLRLGWFPASGLGSAAHWVMPVVFCSLNPIAGLTRITRSTMLEQIRQDYIRTARSKGIAERRTIYRHALKNAFIPVLTYFGNMVGGTIGANIVLETVFAIPGIGLLLMDSISQRNYPIIMGSVLVLSVFVCCINLLVDLTYGFIDPKIKAQYKDRNRSSKKLESLIAETVKEGGAE